MLWSRIGDLTAQIISITSHLFRLDKAVSASAVSAAPSSSSTDNNLGEFTQGSDQSSPMSIAFNSDKEPMPPAMTLLTFPTNTSEDPQ